MGFLRPKWLFLVTNLPLKRFSKFQFPYYPRVTFGFDQNFGPKRRSPRGARVSNPRGAGGPHFLGAPPGIGLGWGGEVGCGRIRLRQDYVAAHSGCGSLGCNLQPIYATTCRNLSLWQPKCAATSTCCNLNMKQPAATLNMLQPKFEAT